MKTTRVNQTSKIQKYARISLAMVLAFSMFAFAAAPAYAADRASYTEWFNNSGWGGTQPTSASYVSKIVAITGGDASLTPVSDTYLASASEGQSLSLVGSDIPNGFPTNIGLLSGLSSLTIDGATNFVDPNFWNPVDDPSILSSLTTINLTNNGIVDPGHLTGGAATLDSVNLSGNKIVNPSSLATLTNLTSLDLSGNLIVNPSSLAALTNLGYLNLSGNQIKDVSSLAALTNLQVLDISNNSIDDWTTILDLQAALPNTFITFEPNAALPPSYTPTVIKDFGTYTGTETIVATIDADYSLFYQLKSLDYSLYLSDDTEYIRESGSTILTLRPQYLNLLANGTYTFEAFYTNGGSALLTLVVARGGGEDDPTKLPATGDNLAPFAITSMFLIAVGGAFIYRRRIKN
jgi:LPXTG-motif cell wall-anchored protein